MSTSRTVRMLRTLALSFIAVGVARADSVAINDGTLDGTVTITETVTNIGGGLFQYNYTVTDTTGGLVDFDVPATLGVSLSNFAAPGGVAVNPTGPVSTGFVVAITTFDNPPGSGTLDELVTFAENDLLFTSTPEGGFIFDSTTPPTTVSVMADLADGTTPTVILNGLDGPVATPEPSSLALCAFCGAALLFWRKRISASRPDQSK